MAKFLRRHDIVSHLHRIIKEAKVRIVLVSPYIDADEVTKNLLGRQQRSTRINVVYGKERLRPNQKNLFDKLHIETTFRKELHAKCYINENEAVVTSMNLYRYSQDNNDEMGILVSRKEDRDLYQEIYDETMMYIGDAPVPTAQVAERGRGYKTTRKKKSRTVAKVPAHGFCIQCGRDDLQANPAAPYCRPHYNQWRKWDEEENYCHTCGTEYAATRHNPLCPACQEEHKDKFAVSAKSRSG